MCVFHYYCLSLYCNLSVLSVQLSRWQLLLRKGLWVWTPKQGVWFDTSLEYAGIFLEWRVRHTTHWDRLTVLLDSRVGFLKSKQVLLHIALM